ncbi:MAG: nucleotidyltransferase family protein [Candidatus Omnitrophota bacterium]|nr:nucleotidyltransferase family protein [Candidatus Omnitrophota bacterium]MBU1929411.1 nucleotidyltransferase family protein [Candidatus Omnitrophota bacterium]MBU2034286.1 nucleotidyltransferase family protein [Candidatus Omnitrophota bacterium]MBU2221850.1 nucleotidyltransferase family protein [Candidatus Omnitrophota bacterium]MBU2258386.1 nucleotidyltransferase family protein [Candidatus Omnitrophota bacterium]
MWIKADLKDRSKTVVILCAGEGHRLEELGRQIPKAMAKVKDKPIINYVIDFWLPFAKRFIFVVGYKKEQIIAYVNSLGLTQEVFFVEQDSPKGIAHALSCAQDKISGDDFALVLGDCLCRGEFLFPDSFFQGVGVWRTGNENYIKQGYSIEISGDFVSKVVEKPKELKNDLCGMGYYFFNRAVFDYIHSTPASSLRNEVEITDVIQKMIDNQKQVYPVYFRGDYLNVTSAGDVKIAEQIL